MRPRYVYTATVVIDLLLVGLNGFVALVGGSRIVLSEAVFSAADLLGSAMLLWGLVVSLRPPDENHPFGRGKERFFWAFAASLVTFSLTGLGVFLVGFQQYSDPHVVSDVGLGLVVVGATLAASAVGILILLRELRSTHESLSNFLISTQLGLKTVFYQDLISAVASAVAFGGLAALYRTGNGVFDGLTTMGVGSILVATGFLLAAESRELLVGKGITAEEAKEMLSLVARAPRVRKVRTFQSMMLGPDEILLAIRINFQDGLTTDQIEAEIDEIGGFLRRKYPKLRHIIIEPES
ncbi:MAG: cation diffusion facilitator family transporter [Thermoplasmata archaeon]|jgi:cation diffusion facilitator family transporter|nr:cation diffusion facilitator family transporter [Thermoplasmata archaeon]